MPKDYGKITLILSSNCWYAQFSGEAAEEIRNLFGSDTIPTAYTAKTTAKQVERDIRCQWPHCIVEVQ